MTTQIGSIDVQFLEKNLLPIQIRADRFSYSGFGHIGWGEAHRSDEACIQIMKHVPFVSIHSHPPTLAPMTHLSIFDTTPSVLGDSFDQAGFPRLIDLHILLFDLLSNFQRGLSQIGLFLWQGLHPGFHGLQHLQDHAQRLFSLPNPVPIPIEVVDGASHRDVDAVAYAGYPRKRGLELLCGEHHTLGLFLAAAVSLGLGVWLARLTYLAAGGALGWVTLSVSSSSR